MKIIANLVLQVKPGQLSPLVEKVFKSGTEIHRIQRTDESRTWERYEIEIIYTNKNQFDSIIRFIKSSEENFTLLQTYHLLEDTLHGGLLKICPKMTIENLQDYEYKILGASQFIRNKVLEGEGKQYTGIGSNIANMLFIYERDAIPHEMIYELYTELERDSAIISHFANLNAFPIISAYQQPESLIKVIKSLEPGFSAFRLQRVEGLEDLSLLDQIYTETSKPVISTEGDEIPLSLLIETFHIIKKHKFNPDETNIGIIGINLSSIRLTRLLISIGFLRVLGYDNNEKLMHLLEKAGGIATNAENIFTNADIIFLIKNHFTVDEFHKIRSGQILISKIEIDEVEKSIIKDRGIKDHIKADTLNNMILIPGLADGIINAERRILDDSLVITLAQKIHQLRLVHPEQFTLFGDIHKRISSFTSSDIP